MLSEYIRAQIYEKLGKKVGVKKKVKRKGLIEQILFRKYVYIVEPKLLSKCCEDVEKQLEYNHLNGIKIDLEKIIDQVIKKELVA